VNGFTCICYTTHTGDLCEIEVEETSWSHGSSTSVTHHHYHHHHHHGGHIFINCNGGWVLQWLFKQRAQTSWLKTLFEKKNDEEWLANLLEKNEIDSEQHSFLKELLEKRDAEEAACRCDDTNLWWKNLFEKDFDGHKPYWAKDGQQQVDMNWQWQHSSSSSHSHSTSHTKSWSTKTTKKYTKKFGTDESESSESSDSERDMPALVSPSKGPLRPLVAQNPSLRGGNQDESESSDSDSSSSDLLI